MEKDWRISVCSTSTAMYYAKLRFSVHYTGNFLAAGQVVGGNMGGTGSCMILRIL